MIECCNPIVGPATAEASASRISFIFGLTDHRPRHQRCEEMLQERFWYLSLAETLLTFCHLVKEWGLRREEGRNHLSWERLIILAMAKSVLRSDIWRRFYRRQVRCALVKIAYCENLSLWKFIIVKIYHCENSLLWKLTIVKIAGDGILSAVSWHHYYLNGRTANIRFIVAMIRYL